MKRGGILVSSLFLLGLCAIQPVFSKNGQPNTPYEEYKHQQKVLRKLEVEKYHRSLLPESGFMTREEYEAKSKDIPTSEIDVPEYVLPKDIKTKYVPQPVYKLTRYNSPPGSVEIKLPRRFNFDREYNGPAITSPNLDIMVYPVVHYYVNNQCTAGDLYVIPLDKTLSDVDRIKRANIIKRLPEPILSTPKEISEKFTYRTMTPVDFSRDGQLLAAKEKIGNMDDGIWQTNLWVYNFSTQESKNLSEIRDAIRFYWKNEGLNLDEKRWDITPLGFDVENSDRVVVSAFGFTGGKPVFLGNWSIDSKGGQTRLVSLFEASSKVSANGFKIVKSGVVDPVMAKKNEKYLDKEIKKKRKVEKKQKRAVSKTKKRELKKTLRDMKSQEASVTRKYRKYLRMNAPTALDVNIE